MKNPFRDRLLLLAFLIVLLVFGLLVARKILISQPPPEEVPVVEQAPGTLREIILYFGAPDGNRLIAEAREVECLEEIDCLRETVQALINGPVGGLIPVIPPQTVLRDIRAEEGTAVVSLSRDLISGHPGGSLSELFTVYGLANTLAVNFPHIRQVRLLVDGEIVDTLKGHVGLREAVKADFRYSRPPEGSEGGDPAGTF